MSVWNRFKEFFTVDSPEIARDRLERLAAIVDAHIRTTWPEVGAALAEIRDRQLYRVSHSTWAAFLGERWDMSEGHASRMIAASALHGKALAAGKTPPISPRLARPIATLPEPEQLEAWEEALEAAAPAHPRPEHVAAAVGKRQTTKSKKPARPKPLRLRVPGAIVIIEPGRAFTTHAEALRAALQQLDQQRSKAA